MPKKPRSDLGTKRTNYNVNLDKSGKTGKENIALKSFWSSHKMEDIIQMSTKELDKAIDIWIEKYQARQIKANRSWWYPTLDGLTLHEVRNKRTNIDKGWRL
jgi:hypothetical protein